MLNLHKSSNSNALVTDVNSFIRTMYICDGSIIFHTSGVSDGNSRRIIRPSPMGEANGWSCACRCSCESDFKLGEEITPGNQNMHVDYSLFNGMKSCEKLW